MTPSVYRTPHDRFDGLAGFDFAPHHVDFDGLRIHDRDDGTANAPVALLLHGEPTWCHRYRTWIGPLVASGWPVVAPDHIGLRSDKPLAGRKVRA